MAWVSLNVCAYEQYAVLKSGWRRRINAMKCSRVSDFECRGGTLTMMRFGVFGIPASSLTSGARCFGAWKRGLVALMKAYRSLVDWSAAARSPLTCAGGVDSDAVPAALDGRENLGTRNAIAHLLSEGVNDLHPQLL